MVFHCLLCFVSLFLDILSTFGLAKDKKDLEIALLRQQLRILERRVHRQVRCTRPEKVMLVSLLLIVSTRNGLLSQNIYGRVYCWSNQKRC